MIVHVGSSNPSDKSVDTPEQALELLRNAEGEKRMIIHNGVYYGTSITLTEEDSGLIIDGDSQGRAVLSGGVPVREWSIDSKTGWFYAEVPEQKNGEHNYRLLISGKGEYLKKARYPLEGVLKHRTVYNKTKWLGSCFGGWGRELRRDEIDRFEYDPNDFTDYFDNENAEVQVYHSWNESYTCIVDIDRENHMFFMDPPCGHPPGSFNKSEYAVYNTVEGMAEDGRWYYNKKEKRIYYRPFEGETVENFFAIVPVVTTIIKLESKCHNITIRNLDVTSATTGVATELFSTKVMRGAGGFLAMEQRAAIEGENLSDIQIDGVSAYLTGGHGVKLSGERIFVRNTRVSHCGAGGITVRIGTEIPDNCSEESLSVWPCIENCRIDNTGLDYYSAAGIFTQSCIVRNNYIESTSYSGIVAYGDNILIEGNIVLDPMKKLLDGAAIYKLLDKRGIIRNNYVHRRYGHDGRNLCVGLYLDAPGECFSVYGNVVKGFVHAINNHVGQPGTMFFDNYIENDGNILITMNRTKGTYMRNNVIKAAGEIMIEADREAIAEFRGNVIRHGGDKLTYNQTKEGGYEHEKSYAYLPDETNSIEVMIPR
ncbi:MAG: right-handed parallel beta-helix repeat-containing protein [Ruminococcaceae bacterium]|nr:right-handed parallel beta-helix repeat-containing protein [Oscillospiraceae bacterium]